VAEDERGSQAVLQVDMDPRKTGLGFAVRGSPTQ
jgi:hypothetical protein